MKSVVRASGEEVKFIGIETMPSLNKWYGEKEMKAKNELGWDIRLHLEGQCLNPQVVKQRSNPQELKGDTRCKEDMVVQAIELLIGQTSNTKDQNLPNCAALRFRRSFPSLRHVHARQKR